VVPNLLRKKTSGMVNVLAPVSVLMDGKGKKVEEERDEEYFSDLDQVANPHAKSTLSLRCDS
jgi:hypothetical protein